MHTSVLVPSSLKSVSYDLCFMAFPVKRQTFVIHFLIKLQNQHHNGKTMNNSL